MNLVLIGMMGSGKSTVGKLAAAKLKRRFFDSDRMIEKEQGKMIAEIFESQGEPAFRELEKSMIRRLMNETDAVISTGGGAPLSEENWKSFLNGTVIWLKASPHVLHERLNRGGSSSRPLLKDSFTVEKIAEILKNRTPFYNRAGITIETDQLDPEESVDKIVRLVSTGKK